MTTPSAPAGTLDRTARAGVRQTGDVRGPGGEEADLEIAVSTERLARDGGVIPVEAWDLAAYRSNPVVLLAHGEGEAGAFPIAKAKWIEPDDRVGELRSGWRFHRKSPESELAAELYSEGFMRSASVAFRLHDWTEPEPEEAEQLAVELDAPEPPSWIAERAELLEVSAVSVPSDPGALALDAALNNAREAGLDTEPLTRRLRALRQRCRAGNARACDRLAGRRGRNDAGGEGEPDAAAGLSWDDYEVVVGAGGERLLRLELGGRSLETELGEDEDPEEKLERVARKAAERLEERSRWRGWGDRVR